LRCTKKSKRIIWAIVLILLAVLGAVTIWENFTVGTTYYRITSDRLPAAFDGYKIAQISDLHNAEFGQDNSDLVRILEKEAPDIIVITGDLVDSNHTDIDTALSFIRQAIKIAPCYYVTGNHEAWLGNLYAEQEKQLLDTGVTVLHDQVIPLSKGGDSIQLIGLDDPDFTDGSSYDPERLFENKLQNMDLKPGFTILLSHRPELFPAYTSSGIDLILSGHTHGGQFRIPLVGGIIAPNQGFLPKYDAGEYHEAGTTMIVSRGIGNSVIPVRMNNRPEVVIVELDTEA
jgi:hypothetical protein